MLTSNRLKVLLHIPITFGPRLHLKTRQHLSRVSIPLQDHMIFLFFRSPCYHYKSACRPLAPIVNLPRPKSISKENIADKPMCLDLLPSRMWL